MAARKTPSGGSKPDKLFRDALLLELMQDVSVTDPQTRRKITIKKLRLVARAWVNEAIKGNVQASEKMAERIDGKVTQIIAGEGKHGAIPIDIKNLTTAQIEALKERIIADLVAKGRLRAPAAQGT